MSFYYYVVESARVDGKPRIVHQAYQHGAALLHSDNGRVKNRTAPVPLSATMRDFEVARRSVARRAADWRLCPTAVALSATSLWPLVGSLSLTGCHPPHLSTGP
jgi:hypothetical protein